MNTVDVLREAKALLSDPARWIKVDYFDDNGGMCALGALARVNGINDASGIWKLEQNPAFKALDVALPPGPHMAFKNPSDAFSRIGLFNDACWREGRHEELIAAFDRAMLSLTGEGVASESRHSTAIDVVPEGPLAKDSALRTDAPSPVGIA